MLKYVKVEWWKIRFTNCSSEVKLWFGKGLRVPAEGRCEADEGNVKGMERFVIKCGGSFDG